MDNDSRHSYKNMLAQYCEENNADPLEVATALALMLHKDKSWQETVKMPEPLRKEPKGEKGFARNKERSFERRGSNDRSASRRERSFERNSSDAQERDFTPDASQGQYRIDIGRVHGVKPGNLIGAIANEGGLRSRQISALKIHNDYSTVFLPNALAKATFQNLAKAWVCGRQLKLTSVKAD